MSAARKGAEIQRAEDDVQRVMRPGVLTSEQNAAAATGTRATVYPATFDAGTEEWDRMTKLKQCLVVDGRTDAMTPFGQLTFSDNDAYALLKKEEAVKAAEFDGWFASNYHVNDIATRRFAQEVNPDYYARREAQMVARAKMALRIKLITMRGPKNEEDLQLIYGLQSGEIQLAEGWDKIGFTADDMTTSKANLKADLSLTSRLFADPAKRATGMISYAASPFAQRDAAAPVPGALTQGGNRANLLSWMQQ